MVIATGSAGMMPGLLYSAGAAAVRTFDTPTEEAAYSSEFARLLQTLEDSGESEQERAARRAREDDALRDRRDRERRINNLRGHIAHLRNRLSSGAAADSRALNAELSMLQTELFWLMSMG